MYLYLDVSNHVPFANISVQFQNFSAHSWKRFVQLFISFVLFCSWNCPGCHRILWLLCGFDKQSPFNFCLYYLHRKHNALHSIWVSHKENTLLWFFFPPVASRYFRGLRQFARYFFFGKFNGKLHIEHVKLTPDLFIDLYSQFNYFYIKSIF